MNDLTQPTTDPPSAPVEGSAGTHLPLGRQQAEIPMLGRPARMLSYLVAREPNENRKSEIQNLPAIQIEAGLQIGQIYTESAFRCRDRRVTTVDEQNSQSGPLPSYCP